MLDEIAYQFPNFDGPAVQVWQWIGYLIPPPIMDEIPINAGNKVNATDQWKQTYVEIASKFLTCSLQKIILCRL